MGSSSKGYDGPGLGSTTAGKVYSPYEQSANNGGWGGAIPTSMGSESISNQSTITSSVVNKSWQVVSGIGKGLGAAAGAVGSLTGFS